MAERGLSARRRVLRLVSKYCMIQDVVVPNLSRTRVAGSGFFWMGYAAAETYTKGSTSMNACESTDQIPRHKVFVSYHRERDQQYRDAFEQIFADMDEIQVSKSVHIDDIDPDVDVETARQKIRDEVLRDSTVTVVLIGFETWKRKSVDWEIGSSLSNTESSPRSGLLGMILPTYESKYFPYTLPPRLDYNVECGFAKLYPWTESPRTVANWIRNAYNRQEKIDPDNSFPSFPINRTGHRWHYGAR